MEECCRKCFMSKLDWECTEKDNLGYIFLEYNKKGRILCKFI